MQKLLETLKRMKQAHLLRWVRQEKWMLIFITAMQMVLAGMTVWFSLVSKDIIDGAVGANKSLVIRYAFVLIALLAGELILRILISSFSQKSRARLTNNMRQELLQAMLRKKYDKIGSYHSGELTNRMFSDVGVVVNGVLNIFPPLVSMLTRLVGASVVLLRINWRFTMGLFVVGIIMLVCASFYKDKMKALHKEVQEQEGKVHSILQETLLNMRIIKASGTEDYMVDKVQNTQQNHYKSQMRRKNYSLFANAGLSIAFNACWVYTIVWGCFQIVDRTITYGTLTAMMQLVGQIQSPFVGMTSLVQSMYSTVASAERLDEMFELPEEKQIEKEPVDVQQYYQQLERIEFDQLQFSYGRNDVLDKIEGTIDKGDFVAITGLSGGGKSTLFLLMLGIYEPTAGDIFFVTKNQTEAVSRRTRGLFAYVPQGNALFSGTIRENIVMFQPDATEQEIQTAIQNACLDTFVESLPEKLDTVIGERALGLSEGQAQRVAIARAILSDAPILLLDEATSALDEETEKQVLENISKMNRKTCLIVTHRPAALAICNKKLELEEQKGCVRGNTLD